MNYKAMPDMTATNKVVRLGILRRREARLNAIAKSLEKGSDRWVHCMILCIHTKNDWDAVWYDCIEQLRRLRKI